MYLSKTGIHQSRSVEPLPSESVSLLLILIIWKNFKNTVKSEKAKGVQLSNRTAFGKHFGPQKEKNPS